MGKQKDEKRKKKQREEKTSEAAAGKMPSKDFRWRRKPMTAFGEFLHANPVGMLFLVLGLGYLVGKTRISGFEPGSVTGVLFVGLLFGHPARRCSRSHRPS